jgi:acetoin utilization deacetylase AcuC-like enzyme
MSEMSRITVYYDEKWYLLVLYFLTVVFSIIRLMKFLVDALRNGSVRTAFGRADVESPERVKCIKKHLEKFPEEFPIMTNNNDYGVDPILEIHEKEYLDYLQTIYEEWLAP